MNTQRVPRSMRLLLASCLTISCGEDSTSRFVPAPDHQSSNSAAAINPAPQTKDPNTATSASTPTSTPTPTTTATVPDCTALLSNFFTSVQTLGGLIVKEGETRSADLSIPNIDGCSVTTSLVNAAGEPVPASGGTLPEPFRFTAPAKVAGESTIAIRVSASGSKLFADIPIRVLPSASIFVPDDGKLNGAIGNVYQLPTNTLKLPDFSSMKPVKNVVSENIDVPLRNWELGVPGLDGMNQWFGIRYTFDLMIATSGNYRFAVSSDDGSVLSLDGTVIIRNDGVHSSAQVETNGALNLKSGRHSLQLDYFQGPPTMLQVQLFWQTPGDATWKIVPPEVFRRTLP